MHTDKEEALINEEAILNIVENSQSFQPLSQRLNQTTVFSEYDWTVFSSKLFYCSTALCSLRLPIMKKVSNLSQGVFLNRLRHHTHRHIPYHHQNIPYVF